MLAPHFIRRNFEVKRLAQGHQQIGKECSGRPGQAPGSSQSHLTALLSERGRAQATSATSAAR